MAKFMKFLCIACIVLSALAGVLGILIMCMDGVSGFRVVRVLLDFALSIVMVLDYKFLKEEE